MTDHIHEPEEHSDLLGIDYCACGWEKHRGAWRSPRTLDGWTRKARWQAKEQRA